MINNKNNRQLKNRNIQQQQKQENFFKKIHKHFKNLETNKQNCRFLLVYDLFYISITLQSERERER